MAPDFSKQTAAILCKRAASLCSNPECRTVTQGPADAADAAISIGSAAHIYGARPTSKRFRADLTERQRAEITNGLWLCRNCHARIDSDDGQYSAELMFAWRNDHEKYVCSKLGRTADTAKLLIIERQLLDFASDSPLARQIIRDRPPGWEYRLTSELLKSHLRQPIRKWRDLSNGLYTKQRVRVTHDEAMGWFGEQISAVSDLVDPFQKLITHELSNSWGAPGHSGDPQEIRHVCSLMRDAAARAVEWEEHVRFVSVPPPFTPLHMLLPGIIGSQIVKLESIPSTLDAALDWAEEHPGQLHEVQHTVVFELPNGWLNSVEAELRRLALELVG